MSFDNIHRNRWTKEEENYVVKQLKINKTVLNLPLVSMSEHLGKSTDSIRRKAARLKDSIKPEYGWDKDESKEAFMLYLQELPLAAILKSLHERGSTASLNDLETELKRLREAWSSHIKAYAEERGLPVAKHLKLDTISFYIENRLTEKDFIRKVLHGKIKNG